jgi:hypothetical protein
VWIAGLVSLAKSEMLRRFRIFAVAWAVLVSVFLASGGKPYYLAGTFPVLLAAGAGPTERWLGRGAPWRGRVLGLAVALSLAVSAMIALPLLPASDSGIAVAMNSDVGETIGWPDLVKQVARVYHRTSGHPVILTANYGEAGAIDRYGPALGLPSAYSGHNAFGWWGPPKRRPGTVLIVGRMQASRMHLFVSCTMAARITNSAGIDNDERGEPVTQCLRPRWPWASVWPRLKHLG